MTNFTVRNATRNDVQAMADLATFLGYPSDAETIFERYDLIENHDEGIILIAENDSAEIVGWVHVLAEYRLTGAPRAEICGLVVAPATQGRGVGRMLVEAAESWAREEGLQALTIRANVVRGEAHDFYRHLGYDEIKKQLKKRLVKTKTPIMFNSGELADSLSMEHLTRAGREFIPWFGKTSNGYLFMLTKSCNVDDILDFI